jgi:hypothetical protein
MLGTYVALGCMVLVLVVVVVVRLTQPHAAIVQMKAEDGSDPLKRWARGCYSILFGQASPGRRGSSFCSEVLADSWSIRSGAEAMATIQRLSLVPSGRVAWDLVRVVVVARLAAGASFISMEQAQAAVGLIQGGLQANYPGWEAMAADYDVMVREKGFDDTHLEGRAAAREIWKVVPFK